MADLAFVDELLERTRGLRERDVRVRPMNLVEVDVLHAERAEALLDAGAQPCGARVAHHPVRRHAQAALGRQHDVVAATIELVAQVNGKVRGRITVAADAADPATASRLVYEFRPRTLVLCAGAAPRMTRLQDQTWETFSENWDVDVAQAFHWVRRALESPLQPGSSVIAFSSGAAIKGSPLSGGYAGANATVRFISSYAAIESQRAGLGIDFVSVLPQLTPATDLGAMAVRAYAELQGVTLDDFLKSLGNPLTPEQVGKAVLELVAAERPDPSYALSATGLAPIA